MIRSRSLCTAAGLAGILLLAAATRAVGPAAAPDATPATAPTTAPTTAPDSAELHQLVAQLNAGSYAERDAAHQKLAALGPDALPELKAQLAAATDTETQHQVQAIIDEINRAQAISPTLITLDADGEALSDVLDELAKQAHIKIRLWPPNQFNPAITLKVHNEPFLKVLKQLNAQANVVPQFMGSDALSLVSNSQGQHYFDRAVGDDMLLILPTYVSFSSTVNLQTDPPSSNRNMSMQVTLLADPHLQLAQQPDLAITQAVDDAGNSLRMPRQNYSHIYSMDSGPRVLMQGSIELQYPATPGKTIKTLKGHVNAAIPTHVAEVEVKDPAKHLNKPITVGPATVTITKCDVNAQNRTVAFQARAQGLSTGINVLQVMAGRPLHQQRRTIAWQLLDAHDQQLSAGTLSDGGMSMSTSFNHPPAEPLHLKLSLPTKQESLTVPFEMTNIPLPQVQDEP